EFVPGPFTSERLWDHYNDTIAADYLALRYTHFPPGYSPKKHPERLRKWVGDSPYFANRPLRGPRGGSALPLLSSPITFKNVPRLQEVVVHCYSNASTESEKAIQVAKMVVQAITGVKGRVSLVKASIAAFKIKKDQPIAVTATIEG